MQLLKDFGLSLHSILPRSLIQFPVNYVCTKKLFLERESNNFGDFMS